MFSSIEKLIHDRASSPLFSTFTVSWLLWNWRIVYLTFFVDSNLISPQNKIQYIAENYSSGWFTVAFPFVSTFLLLYVVPLLENITYKQYLKFKEKRRKMKEESESKRMVPGEALTKMRRDYLEEIRQIEDELKMKKDDITDLNNRLSQSINRNEKLKVAYASYGKFDDMREVTNDLVNGVGEGNELKFRISNNAFSINDPAVGVVKDFFMVFQWNGKFKTIRAKEGDSLNIDPIEIKVIEAKR